MENKQKLRKSAQSVQNTLDAKGIQTTVIELPASTRTAHDAAQAIGCTIEQIVKSLVFKTKESNMPILVLASGPNRVNESAIEAMVGEKIVKADADFVREVTGFAIGGIPPIGHKQALKTFIDKDLMALHDLWAAAGTPNAVFNLKSSDLQALTKGIIITVC